MNNFSNNEFNKSVERELVKIILGHFLTEGYPSKHAVNNLIFSLLNYLKTIGHSQKVAEE